MAKRYARSSGRSARSYRRAARPSYRQPRSYNRVSRTPARGSQRPIALHIYNGPQGFAGYTPGVPGTVGVANVPPTKKGKTF